MEACEYGLTRGTCFVARCRCLEVVAVGGLLWISCCVLGAAGFFAVLFYFYSFYFFFERTRPAASMRPPRLIYLSTSIEAVRDLFPAVFLRLASCTRSSGYELYLRQMVI